MDVKRIPQSNVGTAIDPSSQPSHQDHKPGDKSKKKKPTNSDSSSSSSEEKKEQPAAEWEKDALSCQPIDSETVVEMLKHPSPPSHKPLYAINKKEKAAEPKLNRKY